ncbi:MAG: S8 family serine peptidase [Deltaproteobacteria bacterium]|nr:S8 family serine peptidase [Deltaproteobacteria bacterium]
MGNGLHTLISALCLLLFQSLSASAAPKAVPGELLLVPKAAAVSKSAADRLSQSGVLPGGVIKVQAQSAAFDGIKGDSAELHSLEEKCGSALASRNLSREDYWCEPNFIFETAALPADTHSGLMYSIGSMKLSSAWDQTTGSEEIVVAVIDSGAELDHEDLKANLWINPGEIAGNMIDDDGNGFVDDVHGFNFVDSGLPPTDELGHGTHVAGIIGAEANNGAGIAGVAWNVRLMTLKFIGGDGFGTTTAAIQAIDYAVANGARVINASWGSAGSNSKALEQAIVRARDAGVLFVAAAGNNSQNLDIKPFYPASFELSNVVSVAAIGQDDRLAGFSNYGPGSVDIAAPGAGVVSTYLGGGYAYLSGTSMAAPQVAGVAALMLSVNQALLPHELKALMVQSSEASQLLAAATRSGGKVDASLAIIYASDVNVKPGELNWEISATGKLSSKKKRGNKGGVYTITAKGASFYKGETAVLVSRIKNKRKELGRFVISEDLFVLNVRLKGGVKGVEFGIEFDGQEVASTAARSNAKRHR